MDVQLQIISGPTKVRAIRLRTAQAVVGRAQGCKVRIPSGEVSRRHCLLFMDGGYLYVEDLQSANGTLVNGERITGRHLLRPGDQLSVGPLTFIADYKLSRIAQQRLALLPPTPAADEEVPDGIVVEDELPMVELADEEGEAVGEEAHDVVLLDDEDGPIPTEREERWKLPEPEALRDILSEIDRRNSQ